PRRASGDSAPVWLPPARSKALDERKRKEPTRRRRAAAPSRAFRRVFWARRESWQGRNFRTTGDQFTNPRRLRGAHFSRLCECRSAAEREVKQLSVESNDGHGYDPSDHRSGPRIHELTHFRLAARELHQRNHRKRQLEAKNDLAQDQQRGDFAFAIDADDNH